MVNDFIQILFFPYQQLNAFKTQYTDMTYQERYALRFNYLRNVRNPNTQLLGILSQLRSDLDSGASIKVNGKDTRIGDLLFRKIYKRYTYTEEPLRQAEIQGSEYLRVLIEQTNHFKDYKKLFSHYTSDFAMKSETLSQSSTIRKILTPGGIDLGPAQMSIQIKKEGESFKFNFNGTEIDAAQVTGATFTIRTMTPVTNLPQILGLNQEPADNLKQEMLVKV
jgi:hypothetical protein